jgi:hypothetical protein
MTGVGPEAADLEARDREARSRRRAGVIAGIAMGVTAGFVLTMLYLWFR